jgi:hypothetical protein
MSGNPTTLHSVDFTRRSQGGRGTVRPGMFVKREVEIASHVLPHPKKGSLWEYSVDYQLPANEFTKRPRGGTYVLLAINAMQANTSGIAGGEKAPRATKCWAFSYDGGADLLEGQKTPPTLL